MLKLRPSLCVALFVGLLTGCTSNSQAPARISGTVTYKAKPVPAGNITFHSEATGIYSCPLNSDGTYQVNDLPKGTFVVTIETESVNPKKKAPVYGAGKDSKLYGERMAVEGNAAAAKAPPQIYVPLPPKYADAKTSALSITAEGGKQVHDFTLTD